MVLRDRYVAGHHAGRASLRILRNRPELFAIPTVGLAGVLSVTCGGVLVGAWR